MILIKADSRLKMVFGRLIQTIGDNVEWNGVFAIAAGNLMLPGKVRSLFFQMEQKKIFSRVMEFPADFGKAEPAEGNEVLANALNIILYAFGRWGIIPGLRVDKDYRQLNQLFNNVLAEIHVETKYTGESLKFYLKEEPISYEEVIRSALDWAKIESSFYDENAEEESLQGLWHSMRWISEQKEVPKQSMIGERPEGIRLGHQFYYVDYLCPVCRANMHMVVFPVDHELLVETDKGRVYLARAYTCRECRRFYTPVPGKLIREGDYYTLVFGDDESAYEDYLNLLGDAGDRCSNYKLNEFEADRLKKEKQSPKPPEDQDKEIGDLSDQEIRSRIQGMEYGVNSSASEGAIPRKEYPLEELEEELKRRQQKTKALKDAKQKDDDAKKRAAVKTPETKKTEAVRVEKEAKPSKAPNPQAKQPEALKETKTAGTDQAADKQGKANREQTEKNISSNAADSPNRQNAAGNETGNEKKESGKEKKDAAVGPDDEEKEGIQAKAKSCKYKSYKQIKEVLEEVRKMDAKGTERDQALIIVLEYKMKQAQKEAERIIAALPERVGKREYENCKKKFEKYEEDEVKAYRKILDEKRSEAERQEINDMIRQAKKADRSDLLALHENLGKQGYNKDNVTPFQEKIYQKICEMDQAEIDKLCPDMLNLTFDQVLEAMKKINAGVFLPELKQKTVNMLDKRLIKMKTDENIQLIRKLRKELESSVRDLKRIHFFDARSVMGAESGNDKAEDRFCKTASSLIGGSYGRYEYPVIIGDSSRLCNGKEGFLITPEHLFYKTLFQEESFRITEIESLSEKGLFHKAIQVNTRDGRHKKLPVVVKNDSRDALMKVLGGFIVYLQDKPESRKISYLAKDKHETICCYRCGHAYKGGGICPKCGYKENK